MAVQFILGRSGTGKTSYCIKAIVQALLETSDNQPLILLVPEQATYQAEHAIFSDKRVVGYNRLQVLSFDRLQFLLLGKNTARPELSRIGQAMIIHRILRDSSGRLKVFGSSASCPGLGRQVAQIIAELHRYAKTPQDLDRLFDELRKDERNNLAALKFADIGLVFKEYLKFIEGRFIDPDVQLARACQAVKKAAFAKEAELWVDGFAGFTTAELVILTELLKVVAKAQIALCLDPSTIDIVAPDVKKLEPLSLFSPTERTYVELVEVVKKNKLQLVKPIVLEKPARFSSPQLAHIERNIFELKPPKLAAADNVRIVSAPDARTEVRFVAEQILKLVRENGLRYRDIAVIASDIDKYQHYIKACFDDYAIPFFIDKRKSLSQYPAVSLICSALQVVANKFSHGDIFAFLKSDLAPIARCDIDLLENYCLAFGVSGSDWQIAGDWRFADENSEKFDEHRINLIRKKAVSPLLELRDNLCPVDEQPKTITAEEFTRIIFDFIDKLAAREKIAVWIEEARKTKDTKTADEHRQFYEKLVDIFDELVEVFAGRKMTCRDYLAIVNSAFSQLTLAFIPPALDQVLVGSIERSRHPDLKAVFLIGASQKQFPVPVSYDSILSDTDRNAARSAEFELSPTAAQMLTERQYLAYIAFTRPSQYLFVTYPLIDDKGTDVIRSQFVNDLESLFGNLREETIADEQIDIAGINSRTELADLLSSRLGKDTALLEKENKKHLEMLLNGICSDEQLAGLGSDVLYAVNYENHAQLDKPAVEELFGKQLTSSATDLSTFADCPYKYFARYLLKLKKREEFKFEPLDVGIFYHRVLDGLLKRVNLEKKDFAAIENERLLEILREQISQVIREDSFISNFVKHSVHNAFIIDSAAQILEDCVLAIAEMVRAGSFRPSLSEILFSEYKIELPKNRFLYLKGKIDRLDIAEIGDEKFAVVFDYKRRGKHFSWEEFYHGLDMQLPIYMLAVRNSTNARVKNVVGAFYMPVEISTEKTTLSDLAKKTEKFDYKAKGLFNGDFAQQLDKKAAKNSKFYNFYVVKNGEPYGDYGRSGALKPDDFERVLQFTKTRIIRLAQEILSGKIDIEPYKLRNDSPCTRCEYKSLCRFDWQINSYNFLESLSKSEVIEKCE